MSQLIPRRIRNLSRVQKVAGGVGAILMACCGCFGLVLAVFSLSGAPAADEEAEVAVEAAEEEEEAESTDAAASTDTVVPPTGTATDTAEGVPEGDRATVIRVIDGDTVEVRIDGRTETVRYIGMDTPERGMPFFEEATEANRELVAGEEVILVEDVSERDQYGRLLRYVYLPDGTFVNAELVQQGYAQVSTFPPDVAHEALFLALQQEARAAGLGLWAEEVVEAEATATTAPTATPTMTTAAPTATATRPPATATEAPQPTATAAATSTSPPPTAPPPTETAPPPPTETPAPTATAMSQAAPGNVVISDIYYDGQVARVESDEYAVITNQGGSAVNLGGWRLNADDPGQDFVFPSFELQPGQSCRVYTNEDHPEYCGFSFGSGRALWANSGECGHLYNAEGVEVSSFCY